MQKNTENNVIMKDIHCPYCHSDNAVLLSRSTSKKISIQLPAYGLKFILSLLYLSIVHIWVNGYKLVEAIKVIDNVTYAFCPKCGNSYSLASPEIVKEENKEPALYKVRNGKVIMGLCRGISEYTGISLFWIRIMTVFYGMTVIGAVLYFLIGACISFKDETAEEITDKRFYRVNKGKDIMGLCKGFAEYTGIPVMWVRLFMVLFGCTGIGALLYFLVSVFVPVKENVEKGIKKKKIYKIKDGKWLLGLCNGFSVYSGMPLWLVRVLTVVLVLPGTLYFVIAAIIPTEEGLNG